LSPPRVGRQIVSTFTRTQEGPNVRFGSKADMCAAKRHVCFTPNSDRESEIRQKAMSALPPQADMCGATRDVRFGPKADIAAPIRSPHRRGQAELVELSGPVFWQSGD